MPKIICFDFDGVVVDSTQECIFLAINAYKKLIKNQIFNFKDEDIRKLYNLRPFVRGVTEYLKIIDIVLEDEKINDHISFQNYISKNKFQEADIKEFKKIFYEERRTLIKENKKTWLDLHFFYDDMINLLKELISKKQEILLFFISLKDKNSIKEILDFKGIEPIPEIFSNELIKSKPEGLSLIKEKYKIKKDEILFIDDNPIHIKECISSGYENCFMPSWNKLCLKEYENFPYIECIKCEDIIKSIT